MNLWATFLFEITRALAVTRLLNLVDDTWNFSPHRYFIFLSCCISLFIYVLVGHRSNLRLVADVVVVFCPGYRPPSSRHSAVNRKSGILSLSPNQKQKNKRAKFLISILFKFCFLIVIELQSSSIW